MLVFARLFVQFRSDYFGGSRALIRNRVVFRFISRVCFVFVLWRCVYALALVWHIPAHRILRILTLWDPCTAENSCDLVANETGGFRTTPDERVQTKAERSRVNDAGRTRS